ncbi:MAG: hypothetical protein AVDCRST_MAG02-4021 [uncultured Rubrobacteraceae bacterium]|uniref:Uncharacterized protein n=1 Tax=uncultured Rubrobacteraceae bacterium TaxID=349277 RepID=A0A6J4RCE9_9ACTN|nr:MAG: hypothetical protein AVDCRST_MAG02-4021 [uncultured Rubrobacteraceae bacterium]
MRRWLSPSLAPIVLGGVSSPLLGLALRRVSYIGRRGSRNP